MIFQSREINRSLQGIEVSYKKGTPQAGVLWEHRKGSSRHLSKTTWMRSHSAQCRRIYCEHPLVERD